MSRICSLVILLATLFSAHALRAQVFDDFEDGDFTQNPTWTGDDELFSVVPYELDESLLMLRSNSTGAATYYLSTPSFIVSETSWEFFFNLRFSVTGANYMDAWLVTDDENLNNAQNGYFVRFGRTQKDISFWRRTDGSDDLLFDGPDNQINSSTNNPFQIRITRNDEGLWLIWVDQGATGNFALLGVVNDDTHTSTVAFGFRIVQSGAAGPIQSHWINNVNVAVLPPDNTPPQVLQALAPESNQVILQFNEPLDQATAENVSNYSINDGIGNPSSATLEPNTLTQVTLALGNPLNDGQTYTLTVSNVEDLAGNSMPPQEVEVLFFTIAEPDFREVVFNELMVDENPPVQLPAAEFIELYNTTTDKFFNTDGWTYVNGTSVRVLDEAIIPPGGFLILCRSTDIPLFEPFGPVLGLSSWPALTNAADSLTLISEGGTILDIVSYTIAWYQDPEKSGGGYTLEQINPFTECSGMMNWRATDDPSGGTPGAQNSIFDTTPDTDPPVLVDFSINNPQSITFFFNEALDPESLNDATYTIEPPIEIESANTGGDFSFINLQLAAPIDTGVFYTITITGVTDCPGNLIADQNSIEFLIGFIPGLHEVLINEIMADPTPAIGLPPHEYIELYNPTDKIFDLSDCRISTATFRPNTFIYPGEHLVLISPSNEGEFPNIEPQAVMQSMSTTFLTNSGRELFFANGDDELIDRVEYSDQWYRDAAKSGGGWSLERINPEEPCRGGDNWRASVNVSGGTPGFENSVLDLTPDDVAPRLVAILVPDSVTIELVFDKVLDEISALTAGYVFTPDLTLASIEPLSPANLRIRLTFTEPLEPNLRHDVEILGLTSCTGIEFENKDPAHFGMPAEPTSGSMVINEVLFNTRVGGATYVEMYNNSDAILGIRDWEIANLGNNQFRLITPEAYVLFPGEYLAITTNKNNVIIEYPFGDANRILQIPNMPSLNNSDGQVRLINNEGEVVDAFDYEASMHFPLLRNVRGVSLERIDFDRPTDDRTNWMSAAETVNWGTPGVENSQFQRAADDDGEVWLDPEIFSPDNDGFNDVLNINYRFSETGLAGSITIYDSAGRLLRRLVRNELLGTEGTFSWDGTGEQGERARIGIHIVYFEVYSTDGMVRGYKRSCVVSSRF